MFRSSLQRNHDDRRRGSVHVGISFPSSAWERTSAKLCFAARTERKSANCDRRHGSVLVSVFIVVLLLTLAVYAFATLMLSELEATTMYERDVRARAFADSGIEWVAAIVGEQADAATRPNLYDNRQLFQGMLMSDSDNPRARGRFSVVAAVENDPSGSSIRFGLVDESSKFNLNALASFDLDDEQQRDVLMALPNMTVEIADAILDWLDDGEQPRQFGAENEHYGALTPPYSAKNGRLESLDELLRVRGVTAELLYGEDVNRNGLLDANENDGDATPPLDNADGTLDRGWSAYLTVDSREANRRLDGSPRINVNQTDLAALYDALRQEFDEETARFIVAYRLFGPTADPSGGTGSAGSGQTAAAGGSGSSGSRTSAGTQPTGSSGSGGGAQGQAGGSAGGQAGAGRTQASAGGGSSAAPTAGGTVGGSSGSAGGGSAPTRGGLELAGSGQQITSLYELVGSTVSARVDGQQQQLESPWSDAPENLGDELARLLDVLSTTDAEFIEGRINIAQAPREVLLMVPGLEGTALDQLVGRQSAGREAAVDADLTAGSAVWLLTEGIVDLVQMRELDRYVTGRGSVYLAQVLGYFDAGGPMARLEAMIDATKSPPRVTVIRDLSGLGRGYSMGQLLD